MTYIGNLNGKTVIVTGGAQGIGAELSRGLAAAGANVAIFDVLDGKEVADTIVNDKGAAVALTADITDDASLEAGVEEVKAAFGGVDILVNNAALFGHLPPTPLMDIAAEDWDAVMRVNVRGVWQCVKAVIPAMESRGGGSIVNIATNRVFKGFSNLLHYDASKGAVLAMTKAMAAELGEKNIRVNAVAPGLTMTENVQQKEGVETRNKMVVSGRALKRSQMPDDLVGAVLFFASEQSAFISGQSLIVDGGGVMQ